jgi:hypothetical protein
MTLSSHASSFAWTFAERMTRPSCCWSSDYLMPLLGGDVRRLVYISAGKQLIRSCGNTESLGESLSELHPRNSSLF